MRQGTKKLYIAVFFQARRFFLIQKIELSIRKHNTFTNRYIHRF